MAMGEESGSSRTPVETGAGLEAQLGPVTADAPTLAGRTPPPGGPLAATGQPAIEGFEVGRPASERYLIESELGRGGMGAVYRAFDRDLERHVAMKVLHGDLDKDVEFVGRFVE